MVGAEADGPSLSSGEGYDRLEMTLVQEPDREAQ